MIIKIALLKNKGDTSPVDKTTSFEKFSKLLTTFTKGLKQDARAFIGGHFSGKARNTNNLHSKALITLDVDSFNGTINDLESIIKNDLDKYQVIAHSTASHTNDKPRVRIVLFLSSEIETTDYTHIAINFITTLSDELKNALDITSCTTANKIMFLPTKPDDNYQEWTWINEGSLIEPAIYDFQLSEKVDQTDKVLTLINNKPLDNITEQDVIHYLKKYPACETTHDEWFSVGLALHHQFQGKLCGLVIWNKWSKADTRVNENGAPYFPGSEHLRARWNSITPDKANPLTFATIIQRIKAKSKNETKQNKIDKVDKITKIFEAVDSSKWIDTHGKYSLPLLTEANFHVLLREYKIDVKFDIIKKDQFIYFNGIKEPNINSALTRIKLLCSLNKLPYSLVNDMVNHISLANKMNSWKDWIKSRPWDNIDRLPEFYNTLEVLDEHKEIRDIYLNKWLLQLIHITCLNEYEGKAKMGRMVLTFQGESSIGKTTWISALTPSPMYDYGATGVVLDTNKDMSIKKCIEHVVVELGEIASTYRRSDIDALKNFISAHTDIIDIKYVARAEKFRRTTVFCATVNEVNFLQDQTGNTRFLCIPVLKCNAFHNIDMQQLYAQLLAYAEAHPDEDYNLTIEETKIQTAINQEMESISPLEEGLYSVFDFKNHDFSDKNNTKVYNATNILLLLGFNRPQISKKHTNELARILDKLKLKRSTEPRGWFMPAKSISTDEF